MEIICGMHIHEPYLSTIDGMENPIKRMEYTDVYYLASAYSMFKFRVVIEKV
jgi:hypothetical protein